MAIFRLPAAYHDPDSHKSQRYEGWVELPISAPRPRRDLAIFARALLTIETQDYRWNYDGVQHIMPRLGYNTEQQSSLPIETIVSE
ncbi:MAG: hypothetical protein LBI71_01400, partial [Enterobacteriaceae bacterium]|nr:hypothetical protein [Enterobacteriaceae bacterium]